MIGSIFITDAARHEEAFVRAWLENADPEKRERSVRENWLKVSQKAERDRILAHSPFPDITEGQQ